MQDSRSVPSNTGTRFQTGSIEMVRKGRKHKISSLHFHMPALALEIVIAQFLFRLLLSQASSCLHSHARGRLLDIVHMSVTSSFASVAVLRTFLKQN